MTFVTQFNYFKKSIDSIFYSTPQIFEEIMALRHSLLIFPDFVTQKTRIL